jgi:hypothetical protein
MAVVPYNGYPYDSTNVYQTHDSLFGVGGWREVDSLTTRDAIPIELQREGMAIAVKGDGVYQLDTVGIPPTWIKLNIGAVVSQLAAIRKASFLR